MSNRILTYKGSMADLQQDTILLSTLKGEKGYRIKKFALIGRTPGSMTIESVVKIYKNEQSTVDGTVDFSDNRLLGAGFYMTNSAVIYPTYETVIFDQEIFNQDIYITHFDASTAEFLNYYLELEVIKLDESQAMVATLKDIRNNS